MGKSYTFTKTEPGSWQSPRYIEATKRAIEILESDMLKGIIKESDFWQLTGKTKNGKTAYNGLIISHNGCLKINDALPASLKFIPNCVTVDKDGFNGSLVYTYVNQEQGLYEVGEVSRTNCSNAYPYAMAIKRLFDRVVLKNSKLAYSGIYSEAESEEFKNEPKEDKKETPEPEAVNETAEKKNEDVNSVIVLPEKAVENPRKALVDYCNAKGIDIREIARIHKLNNTSPKEAFIEALADLVSIYD